ncbi:hypothetical protein AB1Y20_019492 [Prymnesium parvum]|uniref:Nucleoplasmin-like domain-containing protein n=1 Tax=Prymnesium parvum TaxID=97485 RepID=A0AB34JUM1_PRYPA
MAPSKLIALTVRPNEPCRVDLPPCSALEIKQAALAHASPRGRAVLECDLATHRFVLCSIPPCGPLQASLSTIVTNDPAHAAWMFLRARGSSEFHVLGRMEVDGGGGAGGRARRRAARAGGEEGEEMDVTDSGWALAQPKSSAEGGRGGEAEGGLSADEVADIEVLLPNGEELEYPSDASSEGFIRWMQAKPRKPSAGKPAAAAAAEVKSSPHGGGRAARRRAAQRRQSSGGSTTREGAVASEGPGGVGKGGQPKAGIAARKGGVNKRR